MHDLAQPPTPVGCQVIQNLTVLHPKQQDESKSPKGRKLIEILTMKQDLAKFIHNTAGHKVGFVHSMLHTKCPSCPSSRSNTSQIDTKEELRAKQNVHSPCCFVTV